MACYASPSSAPSAHPHVSYTLYPRVKDVNNSIDAHFSTDDYSLADDGIANLKAGNGIPNFEARITNLETDVKDIKTALKNIKTDLKIVKADLEFVKTDQEYMRPMVMFVFVAIITSSASLFTWAWRTRLLS
jgi:hypothetical protein